MILWQKASQLSVLLHSNILSDLLFPTLTSELAVVQ